MSDLRHFRLQLFYLCFESKEVYHTALLNLFGRYCRYENFAPEGCLFAFPRPLHK